MALLLPEITELVNTGDAWIFVGSGASIPSGYPSWSELVRKVAKRLPPKVRDAANHSTRFKGALDRGDFPAAFGFLEEAAGREALEGAIRQELAPLRASNPVTDILAKWPAAGYITTNYDTLLTAALRKVDDEPWTQVGNTPNEIRKLSGGAKNTVWHLHGAANLDASKSRLILTKRDYASLYGDSSSAPMRQLASLLAQRRLLFVGFGFNDVELRQVLKSVAELTTPSRPFFAILPDSIGDATRHELERDHNVNVVTYPLRDGRYDALTELLELNGSFILDRTLRFGDAGRPCPTFDEEAMGLLIYNEIALKNRAGVPDDTLLEMLKARVLSKLAFGDCSIEDISKELLERSRRIGGPDVRPNEELITKAIHDLDNRGFIRLQHDGLLTLDPSGRDLAQTQAAIARFEGEQFAESILTRARRLGEASSLSDVQINRVAVTAEAFLKESVSSRALGVAQALYSDEHKGFNVVAVLQSLLPRFATQTETADEARTLVLLVQQLLLSPTDAEKRFLSLALQAQFAVNLLGFDAGMVRARLAELRGTLFVLDAHFLIPLLAVGSPLHQANVQTVEMLRRVGSDITTNSLFVKEFVKHANRALRSLHGGAESVAFAVARGRGTANVFMAGYVSSMKAGKLAQGIEYYLSEICGIGVNGRKVNDRGVRDAFSRVGVRVVDLGDWEGFDDADRQSVTTYAAEIQHHREHADTYRGDLQVHAEAEAAVAVLNVRSGKYRSLPAKSEHAFFVSPSRVVDRIGPASRLTIPADALLQILATLTGWSLDELSTLSTALFVQMTGGTIVLSEKQIRAIFSPTISIAKEHRKEFLSEHSRLISEYWGEDELHRIEKSPEIDLPMLMDRVGGQIVSRLVKQVAILETETEKATARAQFTKEERVLFERFKAAKIAKRKKIQRRKAKPGSSSRRKSSKPSKRR
jgi:hypothetical protein